MLNSFIYIKAFVREGWTNRETGKKGEPRLQFNNFMLLQDVMAHYAKKITIKLDIDHLQEEQIHTLKDTLVGHKGDHTLNFVVYEMQEKIKVNLVSRKQKVQISNELLQALEKQHLNFKLN